MKKNLAITGLLLLQHAATADDTYLAPVTATDSAYSQFAERDDTQIDSPTNPYRVAKSAAFGTEVMDEKEIKAYKAKNVLELLNMATGLDLTYQGRRHPFFVNMRGGGSITYIVDGAILPSSSDRMLQQLPVNAIESIEIVRSSTALSLAPSIGIGASNSGSGLNIGFIVIRTKRPKTTEGLLHAYYEQAISQPAANGQDIYVGTRLDEGAPYNSYVGMMASRYDRPSKDSWFDGSRAVSGMVNGGLTLGKLSLNMMGYIDSGRFEMQRGVAVDGTTDSAKWYYDPVQTRIFSLDGNVLWNENQITLFSAATIAYDQEEHNEYFNSAVASQRHYEEKTQTLSLRHNARFGDTTVHLGGQSTQSKGFGPNLSKAYNSYNTTVNGYSVAAEHSLFDGMLCLDAGYRYDVKHINHATAAKSEALATPDANSNTDLPAANVYTAGVLYNIAKGYRLSARYFYGNEGTSGDFDLMTEDNATLHGERQQRWEIGFEAGIARAFVPALTYFDVAIDNEKTATGSTYTDSDGNEYYYYTEQDSHRKGVEFLLKGRIGNTTSYRFAWTHIIENSTTSGGVTTESLGATMPRNTFSALLSHAYEAYRFNVSAKRVDGYSSSRSPKGTMTGLDLGDYTRVDANIARDFVFGGATATAKLYGRNLTDDHYATRYVTGYYYDRGRTLGAEIAFAF
ncbi:TonB-dependent receptor plug domain-containing protein [Sulfurimonas sp. HSL-3221]|uniref:TonB-dependent receptor plug domain-containing protein n=1 Tax=Sulfurimonadaceae TaxID=2771471 RepID=UPI001E3973D4|nr:TonB-dependent receptor plug domain-containing protein [Sulfurimonas sp. HSL-3221]UFS62593.1 TonB-dependent receptor plug domain-containing protein [Sulfurimonas sp. HSL-3221]